MKRALRSSWPCAGTPRSCGQLASISLEIGIARWSMSRQLGLEVAQAVPLQALIEVNLGDDDGAPGLGVDDRLAIVSVDRGQNPVTRNVFVSAAHQIDVVFARSGTGEQRVTSPYRP